MRDSTCIDCTADDLARWRSIADELGDALDWYADRDNWRDDGSLRTAEHGLRARKALAKYNEAKGKE